MSTGPRRQASGCETPVLPSQKQACRSQWLIDGYNVLHAVLLPGSRRTETPWWNSESRERLIERVRRFEDLAGVVEGLPGLEDQPMGTPVEVCVVFDGLEPEPTDRHKPIEVVFAPSADAYLVSRARRAETTETVFVVSNDRQVAGRCAHAGATIVSPRDFIARCPES